MVLNREDFGVLFEALEKRGYTVVGPTVRDQAIVYEPLKGVGDLPAGFTDEHEPGSYRLRRRDDDALFGYVVGPHSWKKFLFPPEQKMWSLRRTESGFERTDRPQSASRYAFLGVRACEIAALRIQDAVFVGRAFADPTYRDRRANSLVIGISCTESAPTCFCASMGTGPEVTTDHDLALTEIIQPRHLFLIRAGSEVGREILDDLPTTDATEGMRQAAQSGIQAASQQLRALDSQGLPELLRDRVESSRWDEIAKRCLACANCTMACPTCFCSDVEDVSDLTGEHAERWRRWDSCFNPDFSAVHGGDIRSTTASRYRQWLTHKLGTWVDQFGTSGCVGCGRCITWCPVGIDLTEEVQALKQDATS